ncbi:unnamed protein product [Ambrosiozyma monospora]|uniref:Unnamed protein product n=1 Tax=Ambrosiozyma monospora TaxID=43982 RepID=A0ACB5SZY4_AMBMO|nr:unnamed protein product [Ambrosiozyma monospora]
MDGGKDVSAGGVPGAGARDRNSFFQPKDNSMVYGNMFDGSTTANLTANNNLSNNDVDSLALHLMQLNTANTPQPQQQPQQQQPNPRQSFHQSNNNQFAGNSSTNNNQGYLAQQPQQHHHQSSYNKWPSYSSTGNVPYPQDPQSAYVSHTNTPSLISQTSFNQQQQQPQQSQQQQANSQQQQQRGVQSGPSGSTGLGNSATEDLDSMKIKLQLKQSIIDKLEKEVERQNTILKSFTSTSSSSGSNEEANFEVPKNHVDIYNKLAEKLQATEDELSDTKLRLEAVLTAIALNPTQSTTKSGRYDEEEVAHKIITKLQMLTEENDEMAKMLSYGKSKEKDIEIGLLRKQNEELTEKITKLENKVNESK